MARCRALPARAWHSLRRLAWRPSHLWSTWSDGASYSRENPRPKPRPKPKPKPKPKPNQVYPAHAAPAHDAYATQGSNLRLADPRQLCYSHVSLALDRHLPGRVGAAGRLGRRG